MTVVTFDRWLDAPPERAWSFLTDPKLMNAWSVAPVHMAAGDDPYEPGAIRVVSVRKFGVPLKLVERVVAVDPCTTYRYMVEPNAIVRRHEAVQLLTPERGGTRLTWTVDIRSWVPGIMPLLVRSMLGQLESSLDGLERAVRSPAS